MMKKVFLTGGLLLCVVAPSFSCPDGYYLFGGHCIPIFEPASKNTPFQVIWSDVLRVWSILL
jgi:hypothetical protein